MVKLSAFPKCWIEDLCEGRMSLLEWIDLSLQLECDGLELYSGFLTSYDDAYLASIRKYVEERGMALPMMCYSPDFTVPEKEQRDEEIKKQKEIIRVTAQLGGKFTRVLSGQKRPGLAVEDGVSRVVECIEACLPEAQRYGITLVMENHYKDGYWKYPEFAQKMDVFLKIIEQIDSPYFGVQFDPSNTIVANEDPLVLLDKIAPRVKTMHASDRYIEKGYDPEEVLSYAGQTGYHPALKHGVVGQGLNDYPAIFRKLAGAGFDGWISIEDGMNGMGEMKQSLDFLKTLKKEYFQD